jgi:hypothetical protein
LAFRLFDSLRAFNLELRVQPAGIAQSKWRGNLSKNQENAPVDQGTTRIETDKHHFWWYRETGAAGPKKRKWRGGSRFRKIQAGSIDTWMSGLPGIPLKRP